MASRSKPPSRSCRFRKMQPKVRKAPWVSTKSEAKGPCSHANTHSRVTILLLPRPKPIPRLSRFKSPRAASRILCCSTCRFYLRSLLVASRYHQHRQWNRRLPRRTVKSQKRLSRIPYLTHQRRIRHPQSSNHLSLTSNRSCSWGGWATCVRSLIKTSNQWS